MCKEEKKGRKDIAAAGENTLRPVAGLWHFKVAGEVGREAGMVCEVNRRL